MEIQNSFLDVFFFVYRKWRIRAVGQNILALTISAVLVDPLPLTPLTLQNDASLAISEFGHLHLTSLSSKHALIPEVPHSINNRTVFPAGFDSFVLSDSSIFSNSRSWKPIDCKRETRTGASGFSRFYTIILLHQNCRVLTKVKVAIGFFISSNYLNDFLSIYSDFKMDSLSDNECSFYNVRTVKFSRFTYVFSHISIKPLDCPLKKCTFRCLIYACNSCGTVALARDVHCELLK